MDPKDGNLLGVLYEQLAHLAGLDDNFKAEISIIDVLVILGIFIVEEKEEKNNICHD